ncbi:uncharacterized protein MYCFIDRAFT_176293 [Pseudocercospora fijiensis CIRAD86]|uniref:Uncharacterized protein n=1 Tax=Pseudocercospora fijiensis (strain CIRAD86) TaxID=383855 RepID=M3A8I7_PSEFD|nr:uncharacterized protein MYCFIDRAFT_176293 [Pseudocercospora fijiensis CIRAD86]EME80941.1 hypothetical protein MYCFIDRAFT_176293 [Pseudocercospora fijiensis CIRAD86]
MIGVDHPLCGSVAASVGSDRTLVNPALSVNQVVLQSGLFHLHQTCCPNGHPHTATSRRVPPEEICKSPYTADNIDDIGLLRSHDILNAQHHRLWNDTTHFPSPSLTDYTQLNCGMQAGFMKHTVSSKMTRRRRLSQTLVSFVEYQLENISMMSGSISGSGGAINVLSNQMIFFFAPSKYPARWPAQGNSWHQMAVHPKAVWCGKLDLTRLHCRSCLEALLCPLYHLWSHRPRHYCSCKWREPLSRRDCSIMFAAKHLIDPPTHYVFPKISTSEGGFNASDHLQGFDAMRGAILVSSQRRRRHLSFVRSFISETQPLTELRSP